MHRDARDVSRIDSGSADALGRTFSLFL